MASYRLFALVKDPKTGEDLEPAHILGIVLIDVADPVSGEVRGQICLKAQQRNGEFLFVPLHESEGCKFAWEEVQTNLGSLH